MMIIKQAFFIGHAHRSLIEIAKKIGIDQKNRHRSIVLKTTKSDFKIVKSIYDNFGAKSTANVKSIKWFSEFCSPNSNPIASMRFFGTHCGQTKCNEGTQNKERNSANIWGLFSLRKTDDDEKKASAKRKKSQNTHILRRLFLIIVIFFFSLRINLVEVSRSKCSKCYRLSCVDLIENREKQTAVFNLELITAIIASQPNLNSAKSRKSNVQCSHIGTIHLNDKRMTPHCNCCDVMWTLRYA